MHNINVTTFATWASDLFDMSTQHLRATVHMLQLLRDILIDYMHGIYIYI